MNIHVHSKEDSIRTTVRTFGKFADEYLKRRKIPKREMEAWHGLCETVETLAATLVFHPSIG